MLSLSLLLAVPAIGLASPAAAELQPAPVGEDAGCIVASLGPADNERMYTEATGSTPGREAMASIVVSAARRCFEQRRWNRAQLERATMEAMMAMTARHAVILLARANIRPATLERWFRTLSPDMRATMELTTAADLALAQALITDGVTDEQRNANTTAIGTYLAYLMTGERIAQGLPLTSN